MGKTAVVNRVSDLNKFFANETDLLVFDTLEEAVQKVMFCLEYPNMAQAIAKRGQQTVKPHTWDARVQQILEMV